MPESIIYPGSTATTSTTKVTATFTGDVYLDPISINPEAAIANVTFTPCARTHWHTHEGGQVIRVIAGSGWICDKGGVPRKLKTGDAVWAPPGTTHWHGADEGSVMTHFVVGIGKTVWHEAVTEEEYRKRE
ncbi:Putative Cupin domain-containing protein [Aspergillus calidoustus]|uniref:Putative Cupin domain-containing protein n=1 Tax=Aspergillus calidoustus TaxID=454130 RepID=A0A0U4ZJB5_ASPCI|nr:Putative Cupin domain-containing protein [Aspergillus calidoustus]